jgi:Sec-independent protein translocase protein TatA
VIDILVVLVVVLLIVLVWRGPRMLPKWGEVLGRGVRATRREFSQLQEGLQKRVDTPPREDSAAPREDSAAPREDSAAPRT